MLKITLDQLMDEKAEVLPSRNELSVIDCGGAKMSYGDCDYNNCNRDYSDHHDNGNHYGEYKHDNDCNRSNDCDRKW